MLTKFLGNTPYASECLQFPFSGVLSGWVEFFNGHSTFIFKRDNWFSVLKNYILLSL